MYISAGYNMACGVRASGLNLFCWGDFASSGISSTINCPLQGPSPSAAAPFNTVPGAIAVGKGSNQFVCGILATPLISPKPYGISCSGAISLPSSVQSHTWSQNPYSICAGADFICALNHLGTLYCYVAETANYNSNYAYGEVAYAQSAPPAGSPTPNPVWVSVTCSATQFACALDSDLRMYCWGDLGQFANSPSNSPSPAPGSSPAPPSSPPMQVNNIVLASAGWEYVCGLAPNGHNHCYGSSYLLENALYYNSPYYNPFNSPAAAVVGLSNTGGCVLDKLGNPYCWDYVGTSPSISPAPSTGTFSTFATLSGGNNFMCAVSGVPISLADLP